MVTSWYHLGAILHITDLNIVLWSSVFILCTLFAFPQHFLLQLGTSVLMLWCLINYCGQPHYHMFPTCWCIILQDILSHSPCMYDVWFAFVKTIAIKKKVWKLWQEPDKDIWKFCLLNLSASSCEVPLTFSVAQLVNIFGHGAEYSNSMSLLKEHLL